METVQNQKKMFVFKCPECKDKTYFSNHHDLALHLYRTHFMNLGLAIKKAKEVKGKRVKV